MSKIIVNAEKEVAYDSADHIFPWGTRRDNSRNRNFNSKLYKLYPFHGQPPAILDLGCSGGGFVKDCIDDGCLAIGLEGSNYSKILRRAEWATIPDFLFTCDITGDFEILLESSQGTKRVMLDVVTSWDVMEHIAEDDLGKVALNVKKHLKPGGLWISSVSPNEEVINGVKLHLTVHRKDWWVEKFRQFGFEHLEEYVRYFNTQFLRGTKYNAPGSFHLILSLDKGRSPRIPRERLRQRIMDRWIASRPQRLLRRLLTGD